jgi:hypothetical protein
MVKLFANRILKNDMKLDDQAQIHNIKNGIVRNFKRDEVSNMYWQEYMINIALVYTSWNELVECSSKKKDLGHVSIVT